MSSIFKKVINGEIPSYKIAETDHCLAFLDIAPNSKGHTLCIPKIEVDYIFDLEDDVYVNLMQFSKEIAIALKKTIPCERIGLSVIGLEVPHTHVHLIPLNTIDDARFINKEKLLPSEFEAIATAIRANL